MITNNQKLSDLLIFQIKTFKHVLLYLIRIHWHNFSSFLNCVAAACFTIERCCADITVRIIFTIHRTSLAKTHAVIEIVNRELSTRDEKESMIIHVSTISYLRIANSKDDIAWEHQKIVSRTVYVEDYSRVVKKITSRDRTSSVQQRAIQMWWVRSQDWTQNLELLQTLKSFCKVNSLIS